MNDRQLNDHRFWSRASPPFRDRQDAGRQLAERLEEERFGHPVVVGLARGGVEVAFEVARRLECPLDALAVRKVGHPLQPEYAIAAVTPGGGVHLRAPSDLSPAEVRQAVERAQSEAEELDRRLHGGRAAVDIAGRPCLLIDDGLATGATMAAAVDWARRRGASAVSVAVPVGAPPTVEVLRHRVDRLVCLWAPDRLSSVGEWYGDFGQTSDERVMDLLARAADAVPTAVEIEAGGHRLAGDLTLPAGAVGAVAFAHGSGSSRLSPRNRQVAHRLNDAGLATLLFDLLLPDEERERSRVFDIPLLGGRLAAAVRWLRSQPQAAAMALGTFGASTGAAAALWAAAETPDVSAIVSRGGRPDLAGARLAQVRAPTLLIVGGEDREVLALNQQARDQLRCPSELVVVPGATHLFEEAGALEQVADLAAEWFERHLGAGRPSR
jgi:putative phosphoribosyl transferase